MKNRINGVGEWHIRGVGHDGVMECYIYGEDHGGVMGKTNTPFFHYSNTPILQYSSFSFPNTPALQFFFDIRRSS